MKPKIFFCNILIFYSLNLLSSITLASENIFYALRFHTEDRMTSPENTFKSLQKNYKKIDILIPQAYVINEAGDIDKGIEPKILNFALQHSLKIMPLVTNAKFSREIGHQFLMNKKAQIKALKNLVDICKKNKFYGIQLDFEMINIEDRNALSEFYKLAANDFHQNNLVISFAIAPVVTNKPDSLFLKKIYENWEGAYDLKVLGEVSDFVSIMAYNQHGGPTTPGPSASLPWVDQTIRYALKYIPSYKISIGIADYSTHWFTSSVTVNGIDKVSIQVRGINYKEAIKIAHDYNEKIIWNNQFAIPYVIFSKNWLTEYLFLENIKSFTSKYNLVKKYNLRGISVFDLGSEDPGIWNIL